MPISSTLSEINAVLTTTYLGILRSVDDRFVNAYQVVWSSDDSWESIKEAYFKSSKNSDIELPFAALVRDPKVYAVDQMNGYRQWDGEWIDDTAAVTAPKVDSITARGVTLGYELNIFDSRMETSESILQGFILKGNPKNQRVDFTSEILQCPSRISFVGSIPFYKRLPTKEDRKRGVGYLYQLAVPITVNGILGTLSNASRILEVQANIYSRIHSNSDVPVTAEIDPTTEGDHVSVTWDDVNDVFKYTWTGI